jgi:HK97 gp10 family phage protein
MAGKDLQTAIKKFGKEFEKNLKLLAPVAKVNGGTLKKSIKTFADIAGEKVKPGVEMVYYGQYVNDGTYKMAAQPFINDAWAKTKLDKSIDQEIENYLDEQFDKVFK